MEEQSHGMRSAGSGVGTVQAPRCELRPLPTQRGVQDPASDALNESGIVYERGDYWVADADKQYTVYRNGNVVAFADSSYPRTVDGLSIAKARADYLARSI
jgi:hypothetical protein